MINFNFFYTAIYQVFVTILITLTVSITFESFQLNNSLSYLLEQIDKDGGFLIYKSKVHLINDNSKILSTKIHSRHISLK